MTQLQNTQRGGLLLYPIRVNAESSTKRTVRGTTIRVADAPGPVKITAHTKVLGGMKGTSFTLEMKKFEKWFTDIEYDEIEVTNETDSDITVSLQLGYGDFEAEILSRTLAAPGISPDYAQFFTTIDNSVDDVAVVQLAPENLLRKRIRLRVTFFESLNSVAPAVPIMVAPAIVYDNGEGTVPIYTGSAMPLLGWQDATPEIEQFPQPGEVFEIELETTSKVLIGIAFYDDYRLSVIGTPFTIDVNFRVNFIEEVYTAS